MPILLSLHSAMRPNRCHLSFRRLWLLAFLAGGQAIRSAASEIPKAPLDRIDDIQNIPWPYGIIEVGRIDLSVRHRYHYVAVPEADDTRCIRLDIKMGWALRWWLRLLHSLPASLCREILIPIYQKHARDIVRRLAEVEEKPYQAWKEPRNRLLTGEPPLPALPQDVADLVLGYVSPKLTPPRATYLLLSILHKEEEKKKALPWWACLPPFSSDSSQWLTRLPVLFVARGGPEEVALANHLSYFLAEDLYQAINKKNKQAYAPREQNLLRQIDLSPHLVSYTSPPEKLPMPAWRRSGKDLKEPSFKLVHMWADRAALPDGWVPHGYYWTPDAEHSYHAKDAFLGTFAFSCYVLALPFIAWLFWNFVKEYRAGIWHIKASLFPSRARQPLTKETVKKGRLSRQWLSSRNKRLLCAIVSLGIGSLLAAWLAANWSARMMGSHCSISEMIDYIHSWDLSQAPRLDLFPDNPRNIRGMGARWTSPGAAWDLGLIAGCATALSLSLAFFLWARQAGSTPLTSLHKDLTGPVQQKNLCKKPAKDHLEGKIRLQAGNYEIVAYLWGSSPSSQTAKWETPLSIIHSFLFLPC